MSLFDICCPRYPISISVNRKMEASEGAAVEYTSDGEISEQMSGTVTHSLRKLGKRKINVSIYFYIIYSL